MLRGERREATFGAIFGHRIVTTVGSLLEMNQPHSSLVKYDNPILVSTTKDKKGNKKNANIKALATGTGGDFRRRF